MSFVNDFKNQIFDINDENFLDSSLSVFDFQYHQNSIYRQYCDSLRKSPKNVRHLHEIPYLPIEFFKNHAIISGKPKIEKIFKSSGTTDMQRSMHHVPDLAFYHRISLKIFEGHFGKVNEYKIIALLPSYLEQGESSLISMVDSFMQNAKAGSGYFLDKDIVSELDDTGKKLLFGVSYALLDLQINISPDELLIMETGGMKGRKKEVTREELHQLIKNNLGVNEVWSEYGMTELQSQAYGKDGIFTLPGWAKVLIREVNDPFAYVKKRKTGGINMIDLANVETCSFIETKDLGRILEDEKFEVLGRFDNSDIRGCNLLV